MANVSKTAKGKSKAANQSKPTSCKEDVDECATIKKVIPAADDTTKKKNGKFKYGPMPTFSNQRVWSRAVIIAGVLVYVWYTSSGKGAGKETALALQKDTLPRRGQSFDCDRDFVTEIAQYPGCMPKKCGRYVSDRIVTAKEADTLLVLAKRGLALGGSDGGASIFDLHSGALSYGTKFVDVYSLTSKDEDKDGDGNPTKTLFKLTLADLAVYKMAKSKIRHAIAENFQIDEDTLHLTHPTFFSRLDNREPKTEHDEYWHIHIDKVTYESFHYTSLLYLSDHGEDFAGGRLVWLDGPIAKPTNNVTLEPRKGRVAMFSSGAENVHYVERVTSGTRYAITISFTCDVTKAITDPQQTTMPSAANIIAE